MPLSLVLDGEGGLYRDTSAVKVLFPKSLAAAAHILRVALTSERPVL